VKDAGGKSLGVKKAKDGHWLKSGDRLFLSYWNIDQVVDPLA